MSTNALWDHAHSARILTLAVLGLLPVAALAQNETDVPPATATTATTAGTAAAPATRPGGEQASGEKLIKVTMGRSTIVTPPWPVKRVSVTDPKVADIQVLTPTQVLVSGKGAGATDLYMWSANEESWSGRIEVEADRDAVKAELARLFPGSKLDIRQSRDALVLSGTLANVDQADAIHRYLSQTGVRYLDMTTVAGVQQVQIKVVVAEASRTATRALGINAVVAGSSFFGGSVIGPDGGGPINPISIGAPQNSPVGANAFQFLSPSAVSPATTLFAGVPGSDLQFFIAALAENQYMRILAEPSLVALSGQEASFLAGGEFPIPVVQGAGASQNGTSISIEYKEFGVRLRFRPTVLGDGAIRLRVAPEFSQLSTGPGSVQIQGFSIPSLITRRADTTLELNSGQTFGMAGLINQTVEARNSRIPLLGDIPVLGSLFRSVRYKTGDTELIVLVTASLVEPMSPTQTPPVPGLLHITPNDWELYANGQIDGKLPPKVAPIDAKWLHDAGLDRLRGAGAWDTFDSKPVPSHASLPPIQRGPAVPPAPPPAPAPAEAPVTR